MKIDRGFGGGGESWRGRGVEEKREDEGKGVKEGKEEKG